MNYYLEIDFTKVKGFDKLNHEQQELFIETYKLHNSIQGHEYKEDYIPVSVKSEKDYLKVVFQNGEWLHYTQKGDWY